LDKTGKPIGTGMNKRFGNHQGQRIIGIDPGLDITGYAVLESRDVGPKVCEAGVIRTSSSRARKEIASRLLSLHESLTEILKEFRPDVVVVEQLYAHYAHPRTAIQMAHARGVILLAAGQRSLPLVSYNPTRVKKTITGSGRAPKDQVQRTIQNELGLTRPLEPPDVADALAIALCHYYELKLPSESRL
jgi:crossover junction endodeoxyribonuclease RuvC